MRWEQIDTQHEVPRASGATPPTTRRSSPTALSWLPQRQLVFKLDFQDFDNEAGTGVDQFNLGVGYVF